MSDGVTKDDLEAVKIELLERVERSETNLLREFRKYAMRLETRLTVYDAEIRGLKDRVLALEQERQGE